MAGGTPDILLSADLNLVRLAPGGERLSKLFRLSRQLAEAGDKPNLARHHLNLGHQARMLGAQGLQLAYRHLDEASSLAKKAGNRRLRLEALDDIAQLYEDRMRLSEARQLTLQALMIASSLDPGIVADLLIRLEWRLGRLQQALGEELAALAAYQRAVEQIEAVRQDIPIETDDGLSSFHQTLEPIYLGYFDLLLRQADRVPESTRATHLRRAIDTLELVRQSELQDFLGDRCAIEMAHGVGGVSIRAGTAVLYPLMLPDRLELLLETSTGIVRRTTQVTGNVLRAALANYAEALRAGLTDYRAGAQQLYRWLLAPFDEVLVEQQIGNIVVVPDGALRLVPMGALHDGRQFALEKYAVSMVTGLSMTNLDSPKGSKALSLVAGVSVPGPVVEMIQQRSMAGIHPPDASTTRGGLAQTAQIRAFRPDATQSTGAGDDSSQRRDVERLRAILSLPGVKDEVVDLKNILKGTTLLDASFTLARFQNEADTGSYRIVHIASHGVFGGSADTSFIMAYDDILSMTRLDSLLKSEKFQHSPIELLSLSACQTAEGNDRAPLGFSGVAIKARAKSVLGTLWPVEDQAAQALMRRFYTGITNTGQTKTEALRQAQLELLRLRQFEHPFFWAPFVLIGNWL